MIAERSLLWSIMTGVILFANADVRPSNGPIIIKPTGKEIILQSGQNYTLECVGKRPIQFKQQHVPEETTGDFYMEERLEALDNESEYRAMLDLYNVDQFAVGYYACFDDMVNTSDVLTDITEEPTDNEHVTHVYIYVNGSALFAPMRTFVKANRNKFIIECRPTTPDIKVKLLDIAEFDRYDPKLGFIVDSDELLGTINIMECSYEKQGLKDIQYSEVVIHKNVFAQIPKPTIYGGLFEFMEGESFTINCSVRKPSNIPLELTWTIPGSRDKVQTSMDFDSQRLLYYKNITVTGATRQDAGAYKCEAGSMSGDYLRNSSVFNKIFLDKPILKVTKRNKGSPLVTSSIISYKMKIDIESYPPATVTVFKDGEILPETGKYEHTSAIDSFTFGVKDLEPKDSANYTLRVSNGHLTEDVVFDLRVEGYPRVDFGPNTDRKFSKGVMASLSCTAEGYPLPSISWIFTKGNQSTELDRNYQKDGALTLYKAVSTLHIKAFQSGNITCRATNTLQRGKRVETRNETRRFLIQEMDGGFGIKNADNMWFSEHDDVVLKCYVSKYDYANVSWYDDSNEELINVEIKENEDSLIALLIMNNINRDQEGLYTCAATKLLDGTQQNQTVEVTVAQTKEPKILDPVDITMEVVKYQPVNMTCVAASVPPPEIEWYKDDIKLISNNDTRIDTVRVNQTLVNSTVIISQMKKELVGTYSCKVSSQDYVQIKTYKLIQNEPHIAPYLGIAGAIFFILILIVLYLVWKIRKEKQFRKELAAAGLLYFKEGVTKSLNPALGIDEQAELLPYNEKFEFPAEKLKLGQQLGAGAFGVVYKAEARGIINAEESTTVAVKMVKKNADNMYIKALASELKIMVHLGKHINIVNLLGACTKNVGKRELIVIVEYCKFGNIHNYLLKHREVFIDQLNDNSEKTLGKVNRGFSSSSGNSALHSDYFGSNHTQNTDHTLLNTANTNRSSRKDAQNNLKPNNQLELSKVSETGYIQPEWRSNYESDYSYEGRSPRPLCSRDLLAWAFQIARGMEYLASRKVLHGDLAARNVLLAEDNVVKICDFGLARSIYNNDEYQKKENSPLPVKWLAIECMTDRVFSTQSDVWSFGIVLWELFSLAKTPYPNMSPPSLLQWLTDGHRLQKPAHADDRLYEVMKRCWAQRPTARPSFTQLQELLGSFLEDNVRNHYVDLNATYMDMNVKREGEEDYLAMVCAPEYDNIVTPSPHNYVNERSFFPPTPTQLQHDDEGYLQMSPATRQSLFNTRAQGNKFDFELQKKTPRVSEANSYGSESTPMLTLNNLPRSGSESDQEAESASPYLNMCPRIEEEADDVFSTKENNAKNCQPDGVTNPTYITVTLDDKPHYINVSVPNGLVK